VNANENSANISKRLVVRFYRSEKNDIHNGNNCEVIWIWTNHSGEPGGARKCRIGFYVLLANVSLHLCSRRCRQFRLFREGPTISVRRVSLVNRVRLLPEKESYSVSVQAESPEHHRLVVFGDCRGCVLSIPASHRKPGCEFAHTIKMKRKRIIYGLVAVVGAALLFLVYYLYLGSAAPVGQQPLVRLDQSNIDSLKKSFNDSADSVRVMVMLSPT
jgi:hypothetical protein